MLYAYSIKEPIGELNLKRVLDKATGVFSSFFHLLLHWVRQPCTCNVHVYLKGYMSLMYVLRGTEEHLDIMGRIDIINNTLGKALGGAAGE